MAKEKEKKKVVKFKVKKRYNLLDLVLVGICKTVIKKPKIINLNEGKLKDLPKKCILIGNHNGAAGPYNYKTFLRKWFMVWGAHQMCESFRSRRAYLYDIFYQKKLKYKKFKARLLSIVFGYIAPWPYKATGMVPVYYDERIIHTYKYSLQCLEQDVPLLIFPENSDDGYKDPVEEFWPGFIHLTKLYYKRHGVDLPIYPINYSKKQKADKKTGRKKVPKKMVIGKPLYYQELAKKHTDEEITKIFMDQVNSLKEVTQ